MSSNEIEFYIPERLTIPTDLRLKVGSGDNVKYVIYKRIDNGFRFDISGCDTDDDALEIAKKIIEIIKMEHDEPTHGISWRTVTLEIVPQDNRYKISTIVDWIYRIRDSY